MDAYDCPCLELGPVTACIGHAGVGKTTLSLNMALAAARQGHSVYLADMDLVNPYFRSSDYRELLADAGIDMIAPTFAGTTLDVPGLSGRLDAVINLIGMELDQTGSTNKRLIIDAGGDDIGATALGSYSTGLRRVGAQLLYVVNAFRSQTTTAEEAAQMLPDIELQARMGASAVVNTSNLMDFTSLKDIEAGRAFAHRTAQILGLPLLATAVPRSVWEDPEARQALISQDGTPQELLLPVDRLVRNPWE